MRILGFTGTRQLALALRRALLPTLFDLVADEYVTGAAVGIDSFIGAAMARLRPDATHRVIVPANRGQVDPWWNRQSLPTRFVLQYMPEHTTFRDRNAAIVARATELYAYPMFGESDVRSRRSGTWQTVRMARRADIPVHEILLGPILATLPASAG